MKTFSSFSRRDFLKQSAVAALALPLAAQRAVAAKPSSAIDIGSRRELFVDDFLIEKLAGKAELRLHHPEPKEIALVHDAPWEGSGSGYHNVFQDGKLYRMYYMAWHLDVQPPKKLPCSASHHKKWFLTRRGGGPAGSTLWTTSAATGKVHARQRRDRRSEVTALGRPEL